MSLSRILQEDRRLVILRTLSEVPEFSLNEGVLKRALVDVGHPETTQEMVRADLQFLEQSTLVRLSMLQMPSGALWVATLLERGMAVANGTRHEGVATRTPGN